MSPKRFMIRGSELDFFGDSREPVSVMDAADFNHEGYSDGPVQKDYLKWRGYWHKARHDPTSSWMLLTPEEPPWEKKS
jgi:hypothetical protein